MRHPRPVKLQGGAKHQGTIENQLGVWVDIQRPLLPEDFLDLEKKIQGRKLNTTLPLSKYSPAIKYLFLALVNVDGMGCVEWHATLLSCGGCVYVADGYILYRLSLS